MAWQQLLDIHAEAVEYRRAELSQPPVACPYDGEPLKQGPRGEWHCPWGDYEYPRDGRV